MTVFSKRHYKAIAEIIQQTHAAGHGRGVDLGTIGYVTDKLADMFAKDNKRFCKPKFFEACSKSGTVPPINESPNWKGPRVITNKTPGGF